MNAGNGEGVLQRIKFPASHKPARWYTQMCIKQYHHFLVPTISDLDMSKSSGYGHQPKLSGKICKWRCGNQATSGCAPFLYTSVDCITNIKGVFPNPSSCKKWQNIEYHFAFLFPLVLLPLPFLCFKVCSFLYSSVNQWKGEEIQQLSQHVY